MSPVSFFVTSSLVLLKTPLRLQSTAMMRPATTMPPHGLADTPTLLSPLVGILEPLIDLIAGPDDPVVDDRDVVPARTVRVHVLGAPGQVRAERARRPVAALIEQLDRHPRHRPHQATLAGRPVHVRVTTGEVVLIPHRA